MPVEGLDGCVGHALLGVGHETESSVHASVVGEHNAVGHVAVGLEQVAEFVGADFAGGRPRRGGFRALADGHRRRGRRLDLQAEVGALSTVFTDVGCNERGTTGGPGKHGLGHAQRLPELLRALAPWSSSAQPAPKLSARAR